MYYSNDESFFIHFIILQITTNKKMITKTPTIINAVDPELLSATAVFAPIISCVASGS